MSFVHPPTFLSLAIGGGLTFVDLWLYQRHALSEALADLDALQLRGRSVLEHLESSGVVTITRDSSGDVSRVTLHGGASTFATAVLELARREFSIPLDEPLSNKRMKLAGWGGRGGGGTKHPLACGRPGPQLMR